MIVDWIVLNQVALGLLCNHLFMALYLFKVSALMGMVTTQLRMMLEVVMVATWIQVMMGKIHQILLLVFLILIQSVVQLVCAEDVLALVVAGNQ